MLEGIVHRNFKSIKSSRRLSFTHPVDVVVDQLVGVPGPGLEVLHHVPVVGAAVLVLVVARPAVGRDAVHPEGVAHPRVGALVALVLVLVQTLAQNLTK